MKQYSITWPYEQRRIAMPIPKTIKNNTDNKENKDNTDDIKTVQMQIHGYMAQHSLCEYSAHWKRDVLKADGLYETHWYKMQNENVNKNTETTETDSTKICVLFLRSIND